MHWPTQADQIPRTIFEKYSVPRHHFSRRNLGIVNPIAYYYAAKLLSDEWIAVRDFIKTSRTTEFRPIFDLKGPRAFFGIDFDRIEARITEILALYPNCVETDISRYYSTIYTHAIPWALEGKSQAKANLTAPTLGNALDKVIRKCQDGQSLGIPIGPDFSRVVAEIIGVAIDRQLRDKIADFEKRALRFVDDMYIGFGSDEHMNKYTSAIIAAFSHFELEPNFDKTRMIGRDSTTDDEWITRLRSYHIGAPSRNKREILEDFFKTALVLAERHPRDGVLNYAVKRSRSFAIDDTLWPYYESFLLRIARASGRAIPPIVQILVEQNAIGRILDKSKIQKYIIDTISECSPIGYLFEVSW